MIIFKKNNFIRLLEKFQPSNIMLGRKMLIFQALKLAILRFYTKQIGNYFDYDKAKEYTINELNRLFPQSNPVLALHKQFESIQLSPNNFDPRYNMEWNNFAEFQIRGPPNDQIKYFFPKGWKGYALKIQGKYDNGNDDWLLMNSNPNQWHIMYHGTDNFGCKGIKQTGFRAGAGQAYSNKTDMRFNQIIGNAIYFQITLKLVFYARFRLTLLKMFKILQKQRRLD